MGRAHLTRHSEHPRLERICTIPELEFTNAVNRKKSRKSGRVLFDRGSPIANRK